ncbi:MAG: hypothetical protein ACK4HW_01905 [Roseinatronobacter sp.]
MQTRRAIWGQALVILVLALVPLRPVQAQTIAELYLFDDLFAIMSTEGITSSTSAEAVPLDPAELPNWQARVERIYDPARMQADFVTVLDAALAARPDVAADAAVFAGSDLGARVLRLEISAREALLEDAVDTLAREALAEARAAEAGSPLAVRLDLVRERIAANNLIELNVTLGLNTTYAYYAGMMEGAALPGLTEQDIVPMVWSQADTIRADVEDWIESYFLLAYHPLSDAELQEYIAYSGGALGDAFNRMMFQAFDRVFVGISGQVGASLADMMSAQPL